MKTKMISCLMLYCFIISCTGQSKERIVGDGCEDCELMLEGVPSVITSRSEQFPERDQDIPLTIRGTIYKNDGKTPCKNILLYYYHTDNKGEYKPSKGQGTGQRHGRFRGWIKTGTDGKYEIKTFRPASYPNGKNPQHIHLIVQEPGTNPYWIDEIVFSDDPYLTKEHRAREQKRGGSGIVNLKKSNDQFEGTRNIILGLNIPNY